MMLQRVISWPGSMPLQCLQTHAKVMNSRKHEVKAVAALPVKIIFSIMLMLANLVVQQLSEQTPKTIGTPPSQPKQPHRQSRTVSVAAAPRVSEAITKRHKLLAFDIPSFILISTYNLIYSPDSRKLLFNKLQNKSSFQPTKAIYFPCKQSQIINFTIMLTFIQKNGTSLKLKSENSYRGDSIREKLPLLFFQDATALFEDALRVKNINHQHLPNINRTEHLIAKHKKTLSPVGKASEKENEKWSMPKIGARESSSGRNRDWMKGRVATDEKESIGEREKVYHNFINKKTNKKNTHMSKIIDKVISQDIEPWNLDQSNLQQKKYSKIKNQQEFNVLMGWEVENRCQSRPWNQPSLTPSDN